MTIREGVPPAQPDTLSKMLQPGEVLLWSGGEPHARYLRQRGLKVAVLAAWFFLAGLLAILLARMLPSLSQASIQATLPVALLGLTSLAGGTLLLRELFMPVKSGPDMYAITNRRAVVVTHGQKTVCRSYPPEVVAAAWVRYGKAGSGDILFEHETGWQIDPSGRAGWQAKQYGFFGIQDVAAVYRLLSQVGQVGFPWTSRSTKVHS
jgi:hypothetical protein